MPIIVVYVFNLEMVPFFYFPSAPFFSEFLFYYFCDMHFGDNCVAGR